MDPRCLISQGAVLNVGIESHQGTGSAPAAGELVLGTREHPGPGPQAEAWH